LPASSCDASNPLIPGSQAAPRFAEHGTDTADAGRPGPPTMSVASNMLRRRLLAGRDGCADSRLRSSATTRLLRRPSRVASAPTGTAAGAARSAAQTQPNGDCLGPLLPLHRYKCMQRPQPGHLSVRVCGHAYVVMRVCACLHACVRVCTPMQECASVCLCTGGGGARERVYAFACLYMRLCMRLRARVMVRP
jgi:hypothetical protein